MCFQKVKFENIKSESLNLKLANDASAPRNFDRDGKPIRTTTSVKFNVSVKNYRSRF